MTETAVLVLIPDDDIFLRPHTPIVFKKTEVEPTPAELLQLYVSKNPEPIVRFNRTGPGDYDFVESEADILMTEPKKLELIARRLREEHFRIGQVRRIISNSLASVSRGKLNPRVREILPEIL